MTTWTENLLADAGDMVSAGRPRAALNCVLTVLTVHPDDAQALRLAASLAYGQPRDEGADALTVDDLRDPRLDAVFCHCDVPGCSVSWVSLGQVVDYDVIVTNPRGGRCMRDHGYYCRRHFGQSGTCPRCGGRLDHAPQVPNGRPSLQTERLNRTLVHVYVLWEGTGQISGDRMTDLLKAMSPDVFEDDPKITGAAVPSLMDDPQGHSLAQVAHDHSDYLSDAYELRTYNGRDGFGKRWSLVKVFTATPKFVDPDHSPTLRETHAVSADPLPTSSAAGERPGRRWWKRR